MDSEKTNDREDFFESSGQSQRLSNETQRLHLELEDEDTGRVLDTQISPRSLPQNEDSPTKQKRTASNFHSDSEFEVSKSKNARREESSNGMEDSDIEILNNEAKRKSIEIVNLIDSITEEPVHDEGASAPVPNVKEEPLSHATVDALKNRGLEISPNVDLSQAKTSTPEPSTPITASKDDLAHENGHVGNLSMGNLSPAKMSTPEKPIPQSSTTPDTEPSGTPEELPSSEEIR